MKKITEKCYFVGEREFWTNSNVATLNVVVEIEIYPFIVFLQTLYDMLLNMLEERGIDGQFVDQLVDYSTSYEHKKYLGFLEGLQDFANSK